MLSPTSIYPATFSMKETFRKRLIFEMIRLVQPRSSRWKIMVVDPISIKFISATMKMNDILEEDVTLVENITRKRQPYPDMEAIYFLSPTLESMDYFICDFVPGGGKKPLYHAAHLFLTGALPDPLMQKLTTSGCASYIKNLKELYVDFLAPEARLFNFDSRISFFKLYSPESGGIHAQNAELDRLAKKMLSVCTSLGDSPYVRFHRPLGGEPNSNKAQKLALMVQNELDNLQRIDPDFPPRDNPAPRSTLLIVDRTIDVNAPLLHEFTYQAMANDFFEISDGKYSYNSESTNQQKEVILDESDQFWVAWRHLHIADVMSQIKAQLDKFLQENKAAATEAGGKKGEVDIRSMRDVVASLPQYNEFKQKAAVHVNLSQQCMDMYNRRKIDQTAAIEQDMATGEAADGKTPKNIVNDMVPLLDDDAVPPYDKVRLLMLYIISKEGVQDEDRRKLLDHARIGLDLAESITNLALLGVKLTKTPKEKRTKKKNEKKRRPDDIPYELSRYVPNLKNYMEDHISNTLDHGIFPYVRETPETEREHPKAVGQSLRSTKPSWQKKGNERVNDARPGGKLIIFIMGGVTYSEIRSAYEVSQATGRDVIIGSTHIITSQKFIDDLKNLRNRAAFKDEEYGFKPGPQPLPPLTDKEKKKAAKEETKPIKGKGIEVNAPTAKAEKEKKKKGFLGLF